MNAMIHEEYEAPVLTNEAIEVHLTYLRTGFDTMLAALPVLRDKIDALSASTNARFEGLSATPNDKFDAVYTSLSKKLDDANQQRAAGRAALGERIDKVTEMVIEIRASQNAMWVISLAGIVAASVSIARNLDWI